jgi:hypothetical protein
MLQQWSQILVLVEIDKVGENIYNYTKTNKVEKGSCIAGIQKPFAHQKPLPPVLLKTMKTEKTGTKFNF